MRTKVLSVIIFFSFFTISCELIQQNEYYHLSSEYRSLLKTGDTLVYIDSKSETDTFLVFRKISSTKRVSLSGSNCKVDPSAYFDMELLYLISGKEKVRNAYCNSLNENTKFDICGIDYHCDQTILFVVSATDKDKQMKSSSDPQVSWYGNYPFKLNDIIKSMTVLNNNYDSVFYFKSIDIVKSDSIQEIYYSYKYGIIQMNLLNGNVLELVKK